MLFDFLFAQPIPIGKDEVGDAFISTVTGMRDTKHDYETAITHPDYNNGQWIIVEEYDSERDAKIGHQKWMEVMKNPPASLKDVSSAELAVLSFSDEESRIFKNIKLN